MTPGQITLIVIASVIVIVILWWITTSNRMRKEIIKIDEASSGIDVALTKRFDLLTKSIATVKGYAAHEAKTLTEVTKMRCPSSSASMKEKSEFAAKTDEAFKAINVVAENYPDLKASANFVALQNQISEVEEQLQASRRVYNSNVSVYNQDIVMFPGRLVAQKNHFEKKDFFEAESSKRADVKIEF